MGLNQDIPFNCRYLWTLRGNEAGLFVEIGGKAGL